MGKPIRRKDKEGAGDQQQQRRARRVMHSSHQRRKLGHESRERREEKALVSTSAQEKIQKTKTTKNKPQKKPRNHATSEQDSSSQIECAKAKEKRHAVCVSPLPFLRRLFCSAISD
jgi:hypothetical protein